MTPHPFGRKTALPHTRRESNDSTEAVMLYAVNDEGKIVLAGFDRTVVVLVQCTVPKTEDTVFGYMVCPVGWKPNGNLNTFDTMAHIILNRDGHIGTVKVMEEEAGFSESTNDWGKNVKVRVGPKNSSGDGLLSVRAWAPKFIAATPEQRATEHTHREGVDRSRRQATESDTQMAVSGSTAFAQATAGVISRVQCTPLIRVAFEACTTVFADAAMEHYDGCAGLDADPEGSVRFEPIMGPVKARLADFGMRFAHEEAVMDFYKVLREYAVNADCLCVDGVLAGFVDSLQHTDSENYTTLHSLLDMLSNERSPAVIAAVDLIVKEMHMKSINVATERMAALVRSTVTASPIPQAHAQAQVKAPRKKKNVTKAKCASAQEEEQPRAKHARQHPGSLSEAPAPQHLGSLSEAPAPQHLGSLSEAPAPQHLGSLSEAPAPFATGSDGARSLFLAHS
jgi:hypothetical protein